MASVGRNKVGNSSPFFPLALLLPWAARRAVLCLHHVSTAPRKLGFGLRRRRCIPNSGPPSSLLLLLFLVLCVFLRREQSHSERTLRMHRAHGMAHRVHRTQITAPPPTCIHPSPSLPTASRPADGTGSQDPARIPHARPVPPPRREARTEQCRARRVPCPALPPCKSSQSFACFALHITYCPARTARTAVLAPMYLPRPLPLERAPNYASMEHGAALLACSPAPSPRPTSPPTH